MRKKIAIIGAGHVGATTAYLCGLLELADLVLVDLDENMTCGKALDIQQSLAILQKEVEVLGTGDISKICGSDIIIITAGFPRKPGMSREDLIKTNGQIIKNLAEKIAQLAPSAIIITVTNPLDIMTYLVYKTSGFDPNKVVGMGGILDSGRFAAAIRKATNCSPSQIIAPVIGMHGEAMVPLPGHATVCGQPLSRLLSQETIEQLVYQTINGGAEIVRLLQTGSAYCAPAAAIVEMVSCLLMNKAKILPCTVYLRGEYGQRDIYIGVPVRLGTSGVEQIIEFDLTETEKIAFNNSCSSIRSMIEVLHQSSILA